ncbi:MAG: fasciclin domain-containing protein [Cytophagales bacterium]|nr:fasciclin domain-containing protein [Cytophagales bacterium]
MKLNFSDLKPLTVAMAFAALLTGCQPETSDTPVPSGPTAFDVVAADADLDVLEAALNKADTAAKPAWAGLARVTAFAPTDAAFVRYLGVADEAAAIATVNAPAFTKAQALDLLAYHLNGGIERRLAALVRDTAFAFGSTRNPNGQLFFAKTGNAVSVNGARVTRGDVAADNGVVHVIDQVMAPPVGNIVQTLTNAAYAANYNLLAAAVTKAQLNGSSGLAGNGPFTVFAPSDSAFLATLRGVLNNNALTEEQAIAALNGLDINAPLVAGNANSTLLRILQYHVLPSRSFSTTLPAGDAATLLGTRTVAVASSATGLTVTGGGNGGVAANVFPRFTNITATNGVIHAIDRVLIPAP